MTSPSPPTRLLSDREIEEIKKLVPHWERADAIIGQAPGPASACFRLLADREELVRQGDRAIDLAIRYGGIDGGHHKMWVIDQMLRALTGVSYEQIIRESCDGEDGPETYDWDTGIAP